MTICVTWGWIQQQKWSYAEVYNFEGNGQYGQLPKRVSPHLNNEGQHRQGLYLDIKSHSLGVNHPLVPKPCQLWTERK